MAASTVVLYPARSCKASSNPSVVVDARSICTSYFFAHRLVARSRRKEDVDVAELSIFLSSSPISSSVRTVSTICCTDDTGTEGSADAMTFQLWPHRGHV